MKKLIALFLLCIVILPIGLTEAASDGVITVQERVITLPQDQTTWYVSLFGDTNNAKFQELKVWFKTNEGLANLRKQVHYNEYTTDQERYKRYAASIPGLPCVRIQNGKGVVISEFWNDNIPLSPEALFQGICGDLKNKTSQRFNLFRRRQNDQWQSDRCRPRPQPQPQPQPQPGPPLDELPIGPPVIVQPEPEPELEESGFPWLLTALSALLGGGFGFAQGYKKEHFNNASPSLSKP